MRKQQLELSVNGKRLSFLASPSQIRKMRARRWFDHMRRIVDAAPEWKPSTPPQSEQMEWI